MTNKPINSMEETQLDRVHGQFSLRTLGPARTPDVGSWIGAWAFGWDCLASLEESTQEASRQTEGETRETGSRLQRILSRVCVL